MNPALTRKQLQQRLVEITQAAVQPLTKGARAVATVTPGRPHRATIRVRAAERYRQAVLDRLRSGRAWTEQMLRVWPVNVFVAIETAGLPRLLEDGQIQMELQLAGITVEG